jgi:hypothetical protein
MKKLLYISIILIVVLFSCKKQEDVTIDKFKEESGDFLPLSVGNYWIYEVTNVDTNGNSTFVNIDSTYIVGDTNIRNEIYYIFKSSTSIFYTQYLRDSMHYIVDEKGEKFFSPLRQQDTLFSNLVKNINGDTISFTYRIMREPPFPIKCVLGEFRALDAEVNRYFSFVNILDKSHAFYAPRIGLILRQDFFSFAGKRNEYSLIRYNVKQ